MATIEQIEPRIQYREQMAGAQANLLRPPFIVSIRWSAVFAGVAVGMAVQLMLALFGLASGLSILDFASGDVVGYVSLVWTGGSMLVSAFVGGYVSARMSGMRRKTDGAMHGAVSWAVSTLFFVSLATSVSGTLLSGIVTKVGEESVRSVQVGDANLTVLLRAQLGGDVSPADFQTLLRYIQTGQREEAILFLSSMGMDPVRAGTIVDQASSLVTGLSQREDFPSNETTGSVLGTASSSAWVIFIGVFLSLLLGMVGGVVGALGARRMVWKKEDKAIARKNAEQATT